MWWLVPLTLLHCKGATLASTIRKPPNCFNFIRQIKILQKAGASKSVERIFQALEFCSNSDWKLGAPLGTTRYIQVHSRHFFALIVQEWDNATAVAKAFAIGKGEAAAVSALMSDVNGLFLSRITESVKIRGMHRFLTHDAIGRGIFSTGFSSGIGNIEAWKDELTNRDDQELEPQLRMFKMSFSINVCWSCFKLGMENILPRVLVCESSYHTRRLLFNGALAIFLGDVMGYASCVSLCPPITAADISTDSRLDCSCSAWSLTMTTALWIAARLATSARLANSISFAGSTCSFCNGWGTSRQQQISPQSPQGFWISSYMAILMVIWVTRWKAQYHQEIYLPLVRSGGPWGSLWWFLLGWALFYS